MSDKIGLQSISLQSIVECLRQFLIYREVGSGGGISPRVFESFRGFLSQSWACLEEITKRIHVSVLEVFCQKIKRFWGINL